MRRRNRHAWLAPLATILGVMASFAVEEAAAQGRLVEDVQISRTNDEATIVIRLACPMRFQADVPLESGALLEVRVAPFDACRQVGGGEGIYSELYRPVGGQIAHLVELEYESLGFGDSLMHLRFDRPVDYRVSQRADLRTLELKIHLSVAPVMTDAAPPAPSPVTASALTPETPVPEGRRPLTSRVIEPSGAADYMLNLQSTREPVAPAVASSVASSAALHLYVSEARVDGQTWYRLRLGFFPTEASAAEALAGLKERFPRAWIGRAEPEEIRLAERFTFAAGPDAPLPVVTADDLPAAEVNPPAAALTPERVEALLGEARTALLEKNYDAAIQTYRDLVQTPGEHRAQARELLGLAYERSGRAALARAEYEGYLRDFPGADGRFRVQQRLNGLVLANATPREPLRSTGADAGGDWDIASGVAQYYRRDVNQFDEDQAEITTLSAILTDVDFNVSHRGTRVDVSSRLVLSHMYDLLGEEQNGSGDQERLSYAYFDMASVDHDWMLRLGRQSLHEFGVLGRFDGAHFSYPWAPDRELHATIGYPVESTRDSLEADRRFYGLAVELDDLIGRWDFAPYLNTETIEGVDSRMAVGTELRYFDERRTFTSMIDYDIDFGELNTALVLATWQFPSRLTLSALVDSRKSPTLTTRNALIGQPVTTIEELLLVWTEEEVRALAIDRTADTDTVTLGLARPIAERLQLNFDVTSTEIEATVASGGVPEIPGTGAQIYYTVSLVGTGIFATGDVNILNLRYGESDSFKTAALTLDARFPIGQRIRLNPRLRLATWESLIDGRRREAVSPALRFLMNTRNHYRIELEVGAAEDTRTDLSGTSDASGTFVNFGYRANF